MAKEKKEFPDLDQDTIDTVAAMSKDELKEYLCKVAMDDSNLRDLRDNDQDLAEKKEAANEAGAIYRDGAKRNKQRIKLAMRCLGDKGGDTQPDGEASQVE